MTSAAVARAVLAAAYVGYLLTLHYLVWEPDASTPGGVVVALVDWLAGWGIDGAVTLVEVGLNVLLFVPLSLLGAFVVRRWSVLGWVVVGVLLTLLIEGVQLVLLSGRSATLSDLVANTAGALVGILAARLIRLTGWRRER